MNRTLMASSGDIRVFAEIIGTKIGFIPYWIEYSDEDYDDPEDMPEPQYRHILNHKPDFVSSWEEYDLLLETCSDLEQIEKQMIAAGFFPFVFHAWQYWRSYIRGICAPENLKYSLLGERE